MKALNIFEILKLNKVQQGGTIHDIIKSIAPIETYKQHGLLCYSFRIYGQYPCRFVDFDGCVNGRLIAEIPDEHIKGHTVACQVDSIQKKILEQGIQ